MTSRRPKVDRRIKPVTDSTLEMTALALIGPIYDAALNPDLWNDVFLGISDAMGAGAAGIFAWDSANNRMAFDAEVRVDPATAAAYRDYYYALDPWARRLAALPGGTVQTSDRLVPLASIAKSEFYNDFVVPMGTGSICACTVENTSSVKVMASVIRPLGRPEFGDTELRLAQMLIPHLRRAVGIFRHRNDIEYQIGVGKEVQRLASLATIVIGTDSNVVSVSDSARQIVNRGDGLRLSSRGIGGLVPSETTRLQALVRAVITTSEGGGIHPGGVVMLRRSTPKARPYSVSVSALRLPSNPYGSNRAAAVLFIGDPDHVAMVGRSEVARLYGLTGAELRLAEAMASGLSLADAAEKFHVTVATARTQLKSIFHKTGCRRQAELVRLMLSIPGRP